MSKFTVYYIILIAYVIFGFSLLACTSAPVTITPDIPPETTAVAPSQVNRPPILEVIGNRIVSQGETVEFVVQATDPDNDALSITASNLPYGATFNGSTGFFSFVGETAGQFSDIYFTVSDGQLESSHSISITVSPVLPNLQNKPPEGVVPLALIYYGDASPEVKAKILEIKPQYLICAPSHSLWGEMSGHSSKIFTDITAFQEVGIKVIGYITAGYEGTWSGGEIDDKWFSLETNKKLIKDMAEIDHVDGVFIDECSVFPTSGSRQYLKELTDYAKSFGLITWGNVGMTDFDPWYFTESSFDMMHSTEQWHGEYPSPVQSENGSRISVTGFKPEYTAKDALDLTVNAWRKGMAYCYITNSTLGYDKLPFWVTEYIESLKQYLTSPMEYQSPPEKGNTTGIVVSVPVSSGAFKEFNFTFKIMDTTLTNLSQGQEIWCSSSLSDFPNLISGKVVLKGDLDDSRGWWIFSNANS